MDIKVLGIPWYSREGYAAARAVMADGHVLPITYEAWEQRAKALEKQQRAAGLKVVRAQIDAEEFAAWCRARSLNIDAQARMQFANDAAFRAIRN